MKKVVLSLLALVLIYSCTKSDSNSNSSALVGSWKSTQYGVDTNKNNVMDANDYYNNIPDTSAVIVTLNSDGKGTTNKGDKFSWLVNGSNFINTDSTGKKDTAQFTLSGSKLTFIYPKTSSGDFMTWVVYTKQ